MFDIFTEEIEVQLKNGVSNLYWYKGDLEKAWLRVGVNQDLVNKLFRLRNNDGNKLTKRELMDQLYRRLRAEDYNRRLEISRNFVRLLVEHNNFVPQNENHRVEIAETCSLKLKEIIEKQKQEIEYKSQIKQRAQKAKKQDYNSELLKIRSNFIDLETLKPQQKGYELEKIFTNLMNISGIPVEQSFKIVGEQIDGAIKYDGHYYLVEIRYRKKQANQTDISSVYLKAEGKMETRGIFISMNGFTQETLFSLPKGKDIKVLLFDGVHISNVIFGCYTFQELLEHAISEASLKSDIYCSHDLK